MGDIPRGEVVMADFWMSSGSPEASEFLARFKDCAESLRYHLQFVPHYHIFPLPQGANNGKLCLDSGGKFCAPDPDGPGPITGADVVEEDLRRLCIWKVTSRQSGSASNKRGASYSQLFWEYVAKFTEDCPLASDETGGTRFGTDCALAVARQVGIDR